METINLTIQHGHNKEIKLAWLSGFLWGLSVAAWVLVIIHVFIV